MRVWIWVAATAGLACVGLVAAGFLLPGLEEVSWAAGAGSFVLAAAALGMAWPRRNAPPPPRAPAGPRVENRASDTETAVQVARVDGDVNINQAAQGPHVGPVPGWVQTAVAARHADPARLGAHAARPDAEGDHQPPYVARDADDELDRRLQAAAAAPRGGMVLLAGPPTAGKTRALAAAVARTLPDRMLLAPPEDADLRPLPAWLAQRAEQAPQGWVVWLDDVDRHLPHAHLEPPLLDELGAVGAIVAATVRSDQLQALRPAATDTGGQGVAGYTVLKAPALVLDRRWSTGERARAAESGDDRLNEAAGQEAFGVAEYLAAGPELERSWLHGPDTGHPRGFALVAAAVDLARTGLSAPQPREHIEQAAERYLPQPPPAPEDTDAAWEWATRVRSGVAGLLVPTDPRSRFWRAFDYLTAQDPVPETTWRAAVDWAGDQDRYAIGLTAYTSDRKDLAESAWCLSAGAGNAGAMFSLGVLLDEAGDAAGAEHWYRQGAEAGDPKAMFNLGLLLKQAGDAAGAEHWYRRAAEAGDSDAANNLGVLLKQAGDAAGAEHWYRRAAEAGDSDAANNLGVLLKQAGDAAGAEHWYRRAAEAGDSDAANNLGLLLKQAGDAAGAEQWYRQGAEAGDPKAMFNLGLLLEQAGDAAGAEHWYRRAREAGDSDAANNLGVLLKKAGRTEEAEQWFRRAAEAGDPKVMFNLGVLLEQAGRGGEAEHWYRQGAEAGNASAMFNLGLLLKQAGDAAGAEHWYRRAAEAGDSDAANSLGVLLKQAGRGGEAEHWYRQGAEAGNASAMFNLGLLLEQAGDAAGAEHWYRRAREAGDSDAANNLGVLLEQAGRGGEAEHWYRQGAEAGDPKAMFNLGLLLEQAGDAAGAEHWYRRAREAEGWEG